MFNDIFWFDEIRNGQYKALSRLIRYGDPVFLFIETVKSRFKANDPCFCGPMTFSELQETLLWKVMDGYRTLSLHSAIFSTQTEIEMAACNIFHLLRLFGVTLEAKNEFIELLGDEQSIVYISNGYIDMDNVLDQFVAIDVKKLRIEYEDIRQRNDAGAEHLKKLILLLGNLTFKCVNTRFPLWRSQMPREFKTFDLKSTTTFLLPELKTFSILTDDL